MAVPAALYGCHLDLSHASLRPLHAAVSSCRPSQQRFSDLLAPQLRSRRPSRRHVAAHGRIGGTEISRNEDRSLSLATSAPLDRPAALAARRVACRVLPTGDSSRRSSTTVPPWSARAIKVFGMAELEARKLKYPTTGSEALLMGILTEGTSHASKVLRGHGLKLFDVRDETIELLGRADMYFSPAERPPLTEFAQRALDWAVGEQERTGAKEVTPEHVLLGIWVQEDSAGHQILAKLGFNEQMAEEIRQPVPTPAIAAASAA